MEIVRWEMMLTNHAPHCDQHHSQPHEPRANIGVIGTLSV